MDRACLDPGALGEVACSLAGRGGEHGAAEKVSVILKATCNGFDERSLAAAGTAEDDGKTAVQSQLDCFALLLAEGNVTGAELLRNLHDRQSRVFKDGSEPLRRSHLIVPRPFGIQMIPLLMEETGLQQKGFIGAIPLSGEAWPHRFAGAEQLLVRAVGVPILADIIHGCEDVLRLFLDLPLFVVRKGLRHIVSPPLTPRG